MTPEQIAAAQQQLQTKSARINEIVGKETATVDEVREGKRLHAECLDLKSKIKEARDNASARDQLRLDAKGLDEYLNDAAGRPPLDSGPPVRHAGTEDAGHRTIQRQSDGSWRELEEVGAGVFGQKAWDLINSFEYKAAFRGYLRHGERARDQVKYKALNEGADDQGGVLAPAEMLARIIGREPAPTRLRSLVTTVNTGRDMVEAVRLQYAADDVYSTGVRVTSTGEVITEADKDKHAVDDSKLFGTVQIPVNTHMLSIALTNNMVEDASMDVMAWLEGKFGETVDQLFEQDIVVGNGNGHAFGILYGAASNNDGKDPQKPEVILSNTAGGIDQDFLNDLQMALPEQYENENTRWVMNKRSTLSAIRKLKDTPGRPLFTTGAMDNGIVGARGRVLLGDPITVSAWMPGIGAGNFPLIYGDLRGFYLAQRLGLSIQVLTQTGAKRNLVEIVGRLRFGGKVIEPFRIKIGKSNNA